MNGIGRAGRFRNWGTDPAPALQKKTGVGMGFAQALSQARNASRASMAAPAGKPSSMRGLATSFGFNIRNAGHGGMPTFSSTLIGTMADKFYGPVEPDDLSPEMKEELRKRLTEGNGMWDLDGKEGLCLADWDFFLADLVDMGMITNTERFCCNGTLRSDGSFAVGRGFAELWKGDPVQYMHDLCALREQYGEYESMDKAAYEHVSRIIGAITDTPAESFPATQKTTRYAPGEPNGNALYGYMKAVCKFDFNPRSAGNGTYPTFSTGLLDTMREALDGSVRMEELSLEMKEELCKRLEGVGEKLSFKEWDNFLADLVDLGMISGSDRLCCNGTRREHGEYDYGWGYAFDWEGAPLQWLKNLEALRLGGNSFPGDKDSFAKVTKIIKGLLA